MGFVKEKVEDGDVLHATLINNMQDGILSAHKRIDEGNNNIGTDANFETAGMPADAAAVGAALALKANNADLTETNSRLSSIEQQLNYEPINVTLKIDRTYEADTSRLILEKGQKLGDPKLVWNINKTAERIEFCRDYKQNGNNEYISLDDYVAQKLTSGEIKGTGSNEDLVVTTDRTWHIKVTEEVAKNQNAQKATASASASVSFYNRTYYGVKRDSYTNINDFVLSLTNQPLQDSFVTSFSAKNEKGDEYIWYCVPASYGELIFSINNGPPGGFSLVAPNGIEKWHLIKNASGHEEAYYIYRTDFPGLGKNVNVVVMKGE